MSNQCVNIPILWLQIKSTYVPNWTLITVQQHKEQLIARKYLIKCNEWHFTKHN